MAKIFVDASKVGASHIMVTDHGDIRHLTRVLRLREGDLVTVSDGEKWEYECELDCEEGGTLYLRILDKQTLAREPKTSVVLYQAVPKLDKMDTIVRRTTELGIKRIVPVFTERVVVEDKGGGRFERKLSRWQRIAEEASKQCRRGIVPEVSEPISFNELLCALDTCDLAVLAYENEEKDTLKAVLKRFRETCAKMKAVGHLAVDLKAAEGEARGSKTDEGAAAGGYAKEYEVQFVAPNVALIIGPEGGFSEDEAAKLQKAGAKSASLGCTILRTETAGPAALAMTMYELEL